MTLLAARQVKLGFIGLGNMGSRIAQRLLDRGYELTAYDQDDTKAEALVLNGAVPANDIAELAQSADVILSCLTNDDAVHNVYGGSDGALAAARPGTVVLEMSTISPASSREVHDQAAKLGIDVMDVAISGSTPAVEQGSLTLLAGGNAELFTQPIFAAIARQYFHLGPSGAGTTMKLVVNTLLGVGMQAVAEAVVLGESAGLNRKLLLEVLSHTAVVAPAHFGKLARIERNDYSPQFPLRLMNKDFQLILKVAAEENVPMPVTEAAFRVNADELASGQEQDFSAVMRRMEDLAGVALTHSTR
ncbi:MAG: NAD(P)-dependent oxidoreductase [Acidobacteria bacterium]|nr:MAG: NAD(P)-dependent oxidoreductase [Acidobacteriota bacterium]